MNGVDINNEKDIANGKVAEIYTHTHLNFANNNFLTKALKEEDSFKVFLCFK